MFRHFVHHLFFRSLSLRKFSSLSWRLIWHRNVLRYYYTYKSNLSVSYFIFLFSLSWLQCMVWLDPLVADENPDLFYLFHFSIFYVFAQMWWFMGMLHGRSWMMDVLKQSKQTSTDIYLHSVFFFSLFYPFFYPNNTPSSNRVASLLCILLLTTVTLMWPRCCSTEGLL